jgi:hypothetical protein
MMASFGFILNFKFEISFKNRQYFEVIAMHVLCIGWPNGNFRKKTLI